MARFRRGFRTRRPIKKAVFILILLGIIIIVVYCIFVLAMGPVLKSLAENKAKLASISIINNAIGTVVKKDDISYDKLMSFEKDSSGKILAIKANSSHIDQFQYDITQEVIKSLNDIPANDLRIPVGTVIGGPIFTNRGPSLTIDIMPVGNVTSGINNVFTSTGINQTRQQIMLNVKVSITLIISSYTVTTDVEDSLCVAETIVVGDVPEQYTVVDGGSGTSSRIFTYDPNQNK